MSDVWRPMALGNDMDNFTRAHMSDWIRRTICDVGVDEIAAKMEKTFSDDPEFFSENSWWKCYDEAFPNTED